MDINTLANQLAKNGVASLYYKEGSSDKVYNVDLVPVGNAFNVEFRYGRRGGTLNVSNKNTSPLARVEAEKMMAKILKEKLGKGYLPSDSNDDYVRVDPITEAASKSAYAPQLLNPVDKLDVPSYLSDQFWVMQEKKDGERRMVVLEAGSAKGINRKGNYLDLPGRLVKSLLAQYKHKGITVLDGEIIGDDFYPFDILMLNGVDTTIHDYQNRLDFLKTIASELLLPFPTTWYTSKEKSAALDDLRAKLAEGVVFKKIMNAPYSAGRPNSGGNALKYKFYETATVQAGEVRKDKRSVAMHVRGKNGMRLVGYVTVLPNFDIPKENDLIEVQYLYYYEDGALYQPVFKGFRTDLTEADTLDSLKRKGN